jgi:hypothetical protein
MRYFGFRQGNLFKKTGAYTQYALRTGCPKSTTVQWTAKGRSLSSEDFFEKVDAA